jgi:hypothetical protein
MAPLAVIGTVIAMIVIAVTAWNRHKRERPLELGLCSSCGYTLQGLSFSPQQWLRCPECGHDCWAGETLPREPVRRAWWIATVAIGAAAFFALVEHKLGSPLSGHVAMEVATLLPACATSLGLVTLILAAAMTDQTRRQDRNTLLIILSLVQLAGSLIWVWWEVQFTYSS